jgi:hypothetical protein
MEQLTHLRRDTVAQSARPTPANADRSVMWLRSITLGWMLVECAGAIFASSRAHSVALLAFGSDSLVELFSATIVLFPFTRIFPYQPGESSTNGWRPSLRAGGSRGIDRFGRDGWKK